MRRDEPDSPETLLKSAKSGDEEDLGRLLQIYWNYLKLVSATQIDEKIQARVNPSDVVQETFFEAHRDFGQFQGSTEKEFLGWLRQILVNNLARVVERHVLTQKRDVRREVSLDRIGAAVERSAVRLESVFADSGTSPSSDVHRREHSVILADGLAELRPDYRGVLVMRHLEGLSFAEVAERMNRSAGAVRMLWLRAIRQLRLLLEERGVL